MPFITQGKTNIRYILIILILAAVVGGGVLGYCYWWLPRQEIPPLILTPTPSPSDETAGWKTYTDPQGIFSIRYPPEWFEDRNENGYVINTKFSLGAISPCNLKEATSAYECNDQVNPIIRFSLLSKSSQKPLELLAYDPNYCDQFGERDQEVCYQEYLPPTVSKNIVVDGKESIWQVMGRDPAGAFLEVYIPRNNNEVVLLHMQEYIIIEGETSSNPPKFQQMLTLIDKILSTFKFLDENLENRNQQKDFREDISACVSVSNYSYELYVTFVPTINSDEAQNILTEVGAYDIKPTGASHVYYFYLPDGEICSRINQLKMSDKVIKVDAVPWMPTGPSP